MYKQNDSVYYSVMTRNYLEGYFVALTGIMPAGYARSVYDG